MEPLRWHWAGARARLVRFDALPRPGELRGGNASSSGFEGDNYTSRTEVYNPATDGPMPGIVVAEVTGTKVSLVPEPQSIAALFMLGGVSLGGSLFRRLRKA